MALLKAKNKLRCEEIRSFESEFDHMMRYNLSLLIRECVKSKEPLVNPMFSTSYVRKNLQDVWSCKLVDVRFGPVSELLPTG